MKATRLFLTTVITIVAMAGVFAQSIDVYIAGYEENENGKRTGKVWKNGELLYTFADGTNVGKVYVSGVDVYMTVYESANSLYKVWKNSAELYTLGNGSRVTGLHVSGNDVYTCGYDQSGAKPIAKVWKNSEVFYNLTSGSRGGYASAMYVYDNAIYVCGREENSFDTYRATVWKDGVRQYSMGASAATQSSIAHDICVQKNVSPHQVYVSGNYMTSTASIYRNGQLLGFDYPSTAKINPFAYAYSIDIFGAYLYVAVSSSIHKVYKDADELYDMGKGKISDISVYNSSNVYIAGYETNESGIDVAKVWKNGELLYDLTDGTKVAVANAIFLMENKTSGVNDIQPISITIHSNSAENELIIENIPSAVNDIKIFDLSGRRVQSSSSILHSPLTIDISALPAGIYILQVGDWREKFVRK
jgi:hypothetical protein